MGNDPYAGENPPLASQEITSSECPIHGIPNSICGGPHDEVFTDRGWEVGKLGFEPLGDRIEPNAYDQGTRYSRLLRQSQNKASSPETEGDEG